MKSLFFALFIIVPIIINAQNQTVITIDTDFSKGRLNKTSQIELEDLEKFHGHICDGLVVGYLGLKEALYRLYPDSIIDRTNTRVVSKSSPCLTDAAIYLTGGRYQFNTFYVEDDMEYLFIVERFDTKQAVATKLKKGVLPYSIDSLGKLVIDQKLDPCEIDFLHEIENEFSRKLLSMSSTESIEIFDIIDFNWQSKLVNTYLKTDIINKNIPPCD